MDELKTSSKFDLLHAESQVAFNICDCSLDKKYSFYNLEREQAKKFLSRLKHIEKMTWKQFMNLQRENGVTPEKSGSESFRMIDEQNTSDKKLIDEKHYFHFRVEQAGLFRVFGYQRDQFFCITHIDPQGKIQHK